MKVLLVIDSLGRGGAENSVTKIANGFISAGAETHVLLFRNIVKTELNENVNVHAIYDEKPIRGGMIGRWKLARRLKEKIRELEENEKFDLKISQLTYANMITAMAGLKDCIACERNTFSRKYLSEYSWPRRIIKRLKYRRFYKDRKIIAVSEGVASDLIDTLSLNKNDVMVINNPFVESDIREKSEEPFECNDLKPYIINVSRFDIRHKRHDILLEAFKKVPDNYTLVLIGDGKDKNEIIKLIKSLGLENRVVLPGWQNNPFKWIKNSNLFVLSSDYEGLPSALVEALITNTPVVSTDCPSGPREILRNDLAQYLVPVGNSELLAEKILEVLRQPPDIKRSHYERYLVENIIKKYINLASNDSE